MGRQTGIALSINQGETMSENTNKYNDGGADAIAAVAIVSIVVVSLYLWLSGMPH
jgi:hypothetical protein